MTFELSLFESLNLEKIDTEDGRYYVTPDGNTYPSVTTVLGKQSNESLDNWKKRVGELEAKRVSGIAGRRGSAIHDMAEKYIKGEDYKKGQMRVNLSNFKKLIPHLDNISTVYGIEHQMYSTKYKCAGTADLIANWKGRLSIIDYKTSKSIKKEEHIQNYFIQTSAYAKMVGELYGKEINDVVILMLVDHEKNPQIFEKKVDVFEDQLEKVFLHG